MVLFSETRHHFVCTWRQIWIQRSDIALIIKWQDKELRESQTRQLAHTDPAETSKTQFLRWFVTAFLTRCNIQRAKYQICEGVRSYLSLASLLEMMQRINFSRIKPVVIGRNSRLSLIGKFVHVGSNWSRFRLKAMILRWSFARYVRGDSASLALI
jgi:hypothetical protein